MNASLNHRLGGLRAKRNGQNFEQVLLNEAKRAGYLHLHIPSGCRFITHKKQIPVKTPFDFVFVRSLLMTPLEHKSKLQAAAGNAEIIFCDAKTTESKTFVRSKIKEHQENELMILSEVGFAAGYVINFSELDQTVFYDAQILRSCQRGQSLKPQDGVHLGNNQKINLALIFNAAQTKLNDPQ